MTISQSVSQRYNFLLKTHFVHLRVWNKSLFGGVTILPSVWVLQTDFRLFHSGLHVLVINTFFFQREECCFDVFSNSCFQLKRIKWKSFIITINIPQFSAGFNVTHRGHDIVTFLFLQVWSEKTPKKGYQHLTLIFHETSIPHPPYWPSTVLLYSVLLQG